MGINRNLEEFYERVRTSKTLRIILSYEKNEPEIYVHSWPGAPRIVFYGYRNWGQDVIRRLMIEAFSNRYRGRRLIVEEVIGSFAFVTLIVLFWGGLLSSILGKYLFIVWVIVATIFYFVMKFISKRTRREVDKELSPRARMRFELLYNLLIHVLNKEEYVCRSSKAVLTPSPLGGTYWVKCRREDKLVTLVLKRA